MDAGSRPQRRCQVALTAVPVETFFALQSHFDDIVRELQLIDLSPPPSDDAVTRMRVSAEQLQATVAAQRTLLHQQALAAHLRGDEHIDLLLDVEDSTADVVAGLVGLLDAADALSRRGILLTAPAGPGQIDLLRRIGDVIQGDDADLEAEAEPEAEAEADIEVEVDAPASR